MDKNAIIDEAVQKAYNNLKDIIELKAMVVGNYLGIIIPMSKFDELIEYADDILNKLFSKFCDEIADKVTDDDIEFINYKTFINNDPSEELINDCFKIVNNRITNKKSSNETTLYSLLNSIKEKHSKEEIGKSLDTIFDILLDYYSIIRK